tara:strand:+ start:509 stop:1390 length:882 start_codon:yes stop_codon:yes gene_type:complete
MNNNKRKGIILAGGSGTRLHPMTISVSKQLLPVYDKPMIYYPLSTLMQAGINDILIISTPHDLPNLEKLLKDGSQWGLNFSYQVQKEPNGIAQAFVIGKNFIGTDNSALILGDNIFFGQSLQIDLQKVSKRESGASIFAYKVSNPQDYGVVEFNKKNQAVSIEEKPSSPKSNYVIPGMYFYDNTVIDIVKDLKPSARGEYEITDVNSHYLKKNNLHVNILGRGTAWLDAGTPSSLLEAGQLIEVIEKRQGLKISSPEEIAWELGYIDDEKLLALSNKLEKSSYGLYLKSILED